MFDKGLRNQVVKSEWFKQLAKYERPHLGRSVWQMIDTLVPYAAMWVLMVWMVKHGFSYGLVLPLTLVASGLLVRTFIIFHDCGHGSFFASARANRVVGFVCGILAFTPYDDWRHPHAIHHASTGHLEKRGNGDIWTMTVDEYLNASRAQRFAYRFYRHPAVLFGIGPLYMFLISHRIPHKGCGARDRESVHITNAAILAIVVLASLTIGFKTYFMIQLPIIFFAAAIGTWLFYVQHQFDPMYWARGEEWDPIAAALEGSSYYRLPKVLQWFTGNIGLHHIHHLKPRIPNYNLQRCYDEFDALKVENPLTLTRSVKSVWMNLWDETNQRLISFRALKRQQRQMAS